jgi:hypothetical protein
MKKARSWAYLPAFCLLVSPLFAGASTSELKLGSDNAEFGSEASLALSLSTADAVSVSVWRGASGTRAGLGSGYRPELPLGPDPTEYKLHCASATNCG